MMVAVDTAAASAYQMAAGTGWVLVYECRGEGCARLGAVPATLAVLGHLFACAWCGHQQPVTPDDVLERRAVLTDPENGRFLVQSEGALNG